jgi:trigger factor
MLIDAGVVRPGTDLPASEAALPEALREEFTVRAQKQVQAVFLLDALAKQLELSVSDEELQQQIAEVAASAGVERQPQVEAFYAKDENRRTLRNRLLHDKALRVVVEKAQVKVVEADIAGGQEKD